MMWQGGNGAWGYLWMILVWVVIIGLIWAGYRAFGSDRRPEPGRDPKETLAERFAKGEIDAEEYRERSAVLEEKRTRMSGR